MVLSACQTALGREIKGEGLIGLTRGFLYAGAPRVIASLWEVYDRATAELMKRLYERMLRDGEKPTAALRAARRRLEDQRVGRAILLGRLYAPGRVAVTGESEGASRRKWTLTREAFDGLLAALHPDRDTAAERYLEVRRNLVRLFEWRGSSSPDEGADESLARCARKIAEGEEIRDVATYAIGVARMVFREVARERAREPLPLPESAAAADPPPAAGAGLEERAECLGRCLGQLPPDSRSLILNYYQGEKGDKIKIRARLGRVLGIPSNTLRMRALRLREKLQSCVEGCVACGETRM